MTIARLSLVDFRSYRDVVIAPGPGINVLTGDNGVGKTNILEAVSLLAPGRGLRGAPLRELANSSGVGGFSIAARTPDNDLGVGALAGEPDRRLVRIDGAAASANALAQRLAIVWVTPAMDRIFNDSAGERRRFLDRLVLALDPVHAGHSARYEAAMRQRNRLLAAEAPADPAWLTALETAMGEHGAAITRARLETIEAIARAQASRADSDFPSSRMMLTNIIMENLKERLSATRRLDAAAKRTLQGPHTQDLEVIYVAKNEAARRCSTGEQKALLLGIILAHADIVAERRGTQPILLLDEVAAHLDPARREALFARLTGRGQVWMTGTETAPFAALGSTTRHFAVSPGGVDAI